MDAEDKAVLIIAFTIVIIGALLLGAQAEGRIWKKLAVEHGAAHWVVADDGTTTFEWNEPERKETK